MSGQCTRMAELPTTKSELVKPFSVYAFAMFRRRVKKQAPTFPDTIEGFGYVVKENGEIRSKDTGRGKETLSRYRYKILLL